MKIVKNCLLAVGETKSWLAAQVMRSGTSSNPQFTATAYYYIWDFYRWEPWEVEWNRNHKIMGIYDHQLASLHAAGMAKEYEIGNSYRAMTVTWSAGEQIDQNNVLSHIAYM